MIQFHEDSFDQFNILARIVASALTQTFTGSVSGALVDEDSA
jgi:hypothetical protein